MNLTVQGRHAGQQTNQVDLALADAQTVLKAAIHHLEERFAGTMADPIVKACASLTH